MWKHRKSSRRIAAVLKDEDGSATIEAVIWIPVFMFVFSLVVDFALVFGGEARILRVIQDANRAMSIGLVRDVTVTQQNVKAQIGGLSPRAVVRTNIVAGLVTTTVEFPASDLTSVGFVDSLLTMNLRVTAQHLAEG